ncbi:type II secretion system protein M [Dickeya dadantii]|uniref:type II secretion system protein GspM n=1 Tax=Dickeya dadantii TaxID=204038 RepID=UPI001CF0DB0C|nr:type II secretion system protein GspM [Dickeya dadantii]MCA7012904.1 type II secretion system protein M [Dickeya dadantii]
MNAILQTWRAFTRGQRRWLAGMGTIVIFLFALLVHFREKSALLHQASVWVAQQQDFTVWLAARPDKKTLALPLQDALQRSTPPATLATAFQYHQREAVLAAPATVRFNELFLWLSDLQQQYGIRVVKLDAVPTGDPGDIRLMHLVLHPSEAIE